MAHRSLTLLHGRGRALVAALLVVVATALGVGVPSAAVAVPVVGLGGGSTLAGERMSEDPVGQWPLRPQPEVVRRFDPPDSTWGAGHRGVDLLGHPGEAVYAALQGRISYAGVLAGRGVVVVDHGATRTTYEPVAALVHVGDTVTAGQRIGTLEVVQSHCAPRTCLHWGWIDNATGDYLDPLRLVDAPQPVRLLPLWRGAPVGSTVTAVDARPATPNTAWRDQARGCACW